MPSPDHAPLAVPRQTLEHVLGRLLGASERDVVEKALREGVDEFGDADLLRLVHALACHGMGLSPDGLLVFDAATRIVVRLARSGHPSSELSEEMARLLALAENELVSPIDTKEWNRSSIGAKASRVTRKQ
jgi:hypothetical protein